MMPIGYLKVIYQMIHRTMIEGYDRVIQIVVVETGYINIILHIQL